MVALYSNFDAVAIGIEGDAFVIAITGSAGAIENGKAVLLEPLGEVVHELFGTDGNGKVSESHALRAGLGSQGRELGGLHDFEARAIGESQETGFKALGGVRVFRPGLGTEIGDVELFAAVEVGGPQGDVFDAHG